MSQPSSYAPVFKISASTASNHDQKDQKFQPRTLSTTTSRSDDKNTEQYAGTMSEIAQQEKFKKLVTLITYIFPKVRLQAHALSYLLYKYRNSKDPGNQIIYAVVMEDMSEVERILAHRSEKEITLILNRKNIHGMDVLYIAAINGNIGLVDYLLQYNASYTSTSFQGAGPTIFQAINLLTEGAQAETFQTSAMFQVYSKITETLNQNLCKFAQLPDNKNESKTNLSESKSKNSKVNPKKSKPKSSAVNFKPFPATKYIIFKKRELELYIEEACPILVKAACKGFLKEAQLQLTYSVRSKAGNPLINSRGKHGLTPLHWAVIQENWAMVLFFVGVANADITLKSHGGNGGTALEFAEHYKDLTEGDTTRLAIYRYLLAVRDFKEKRVMEIKGTDLIPPLDLEIKSYRDPTQRYLYFLNDRQYIALPFGPTDVDYLGLNKQSQHIYCLRDVATQESMQITLPSQIITLEFLGPVINATLDCWNINTTMNIADMYPNVTYPRLHLSQPAFVPSELRRGEQKQSVFVPAELRRDEKQQQVFHAPTSSFQRNKASRASEILGQFQQVTQTAQGNAQVTANKI